MTSAPLITIRPGPTMCIWRDGSLMLEIPLSFDAAVTLIRDLAQAVWAGYKQP